MRRYSLEPRETEAAKIHREDSQRRESWTEREREFWRSICFKAAFFLLATIFSQIEVVFGWVGNRKPSEHWLKYIGVYFLLLKEVWRKVAARGG